MSLKKRLARQEKTVEDAFRYRALARFIPLAERAPLTLSQWGRLADLHDLARKLLRARLRAGARLLTCRPERAEQEEALLLSGEEVYTGECEACNLLTGADREEFEKLLFLWWDAHKSRFLEDLIQEHGHHWTDDEKAELRLRVRG